MPSIIDELREKRDWEQRKSSGLVPLMLGVMVAFAVGGVLAFGYLKMPFLAGSSGTSSATTGQAVKVPSFGGGRLGHAEKAQILRTCAPLSRLGFSSRMGGGPNELEPGDIYRLLQAGSSISSLAAASGVRQSGAEATGFTSLWGEVADCIFRQNGWSLCDPDNRALAVEATTAFFRHFSQATAGKPDTPIGSAEKAFAQVRADIDASLDKIDRRSSSSTSSAQYRMQMARQQRDRVLSGLRSRASEGRLISSDFGMFAPNDIGQVFKDVKPTRDACADKG